MWLCKMLLESKDLDMDGYIMHMHGLFYFHLRLTVWVRIGIDGLGFHSPPPPSSRLSQSFNYDQEENIWATKHVQMKIFRTCQILQLCLMSSLHPRSLKNKKNQNLRTWNIIFVPQMISNKNVLNNKVVEPLRPLQLWYKVFSFISIDSERLCYTYF
jgi:hypothetical protein